MGLIGQYGYALDNRVDGLDLVAQATFDNFVPDIMMQSGESCLMTPGHAPLCAALYLGSE